jgi:hypothetical protein
MEISRRPRDFPESRIEVAQGRVRTHLGMRSAHVLSVFGLFRRMVTAHLRTQPSCRYTPVDVKVTARFVVLLTLLAFARGPALACYALPAAAGATSDECCRMMGGACPSKTAPASSPQSCCHPDNQGDRAYVRASAAPVAAPQMATLMAWVVPAADRPVTRAVRTPAVRSHAPPGRLFLSLSALRI